MTRIPAGRRLDAAAGGLGSRVGGRVRVASSGIQPL